LVHGGLSLTVGFIDNPRILGSPTEREARPRSVIASLRRATFGPFRWACSGG